MEGLRGAPNRSGCEPACYSRDRVRGIGIHEGGGTVKAGAERVFGGAAGFGRRRVEGGVNTQPPQRVARGGTVLRPSGVRRRI